MKKNSLIIFFVNLVLLACTNSGRSADDTFSGQSVRKDTMFIESQKVAVFIVPTDAEIDRMKSGYDSEEDFYAMADDGAFYSDNARVYLEHSGVDIVVADTTCRVLNYGNASYIDLSDTTIIGNPLFNLVLYNGSCPVIVSSIEIKAEAPDYFGLPFESVVGGQSDWEAGNGSFHITAPNDLDSMEILRAAILKLEKPAFQGKIPVSVYDSTSVNGFFVGQGIDSSVRLYKSFPDKGAIKVILFAYLRECHNDSYPALELQTFDRENNFIDRLLVSTSIFEEGGLYRHSAVDKNYRVTVTDVTVNYDLENDADQESVTEQSYNYVIDSNGFFKLQ